MESNATEPEGCDGMSNALRAMAYKEERRQRLGLAMHCIQEGPCLDGDVRIVNGLQFLTPRRQKMAEREKAMTELALF